MNRTSLRSSFILTLAIVLNLFWYNQSVAGELKAVEFLGLKSRLPVAWVEEKPSSSMRLVQYRVPGTAAGGDANLVVYYFGLGQGGSTEANIARWQSQFSGPGGDVVKPRIETMGVNGMPVTLVELRGDYARSVGMGPAGTAAPDQILLASIVETARGNIYIQLYGPAGTVSRQRDAYIKLIRNIQSE